MYLYVLLICLPHHHQPSLFPTMLVGSQSNRTQLSTSNQNYFRIFYFSFIADSIFGLSAMKNVIYKHALNLGIVIETLWIRNTKLSNVNKFNEGVIVDDRERWFIIPADIICSTWTIEDVNVNNNTSCLHNIVVKYRLRQRTKV